MKLNWDFLEGGGGKTKTLMDSFWNYILSICFNRSRRPKGCPTFIT